MEKDERIKIGVHLGGINSKNYAVALKALSDQRMFDEHTTILYGQSDMMQELKKSLGFNEVNFYLTKDIQANIHVKKINLFDLMDPSGQNDLADLSLQKLWEAVADHQTHAVITFPTEKTFDYAAYFADKAKLNTYVKMFVSEDLKLSFVSLRDEASVPVTEELVMEKIRAFNEALKESFAVTVPKIAFVVKDGTNKTVVQSAITKVFDEHIMVFSVKDEEQLYTYDHLKDFDGIMYVFEPECMQPFHYFSDETLCVYTAGFTFIHMDLINLPRTQDTDVNAQRFRSALGLAKEIFEHKKEYVRLTKNSLPFVKKEKE